MFLPEYICLNVCKKSKASSINLLGKVKDLYQRGNIAKLLSLARPAKSDSYQDLRKRNKATAAELVCLKILTDALYVSY